MKHRHPQKKLLRVYRRLDKELRILTLFCIEDGQYELILGMVLSKRWNIITSKTAKPERHIF